MMALQLFILALVHTHTQVREAIRTQGSVTKAYDIVNVDRSALGRVAGAVAKPYGDSGGFCLVVLVGWPEVAALVESQLCRTARLVGGSSLSSLTCAHNLKTCGCLTHALHTRYCYLHLLHHQQTGFKGSINLNLTGSGGQSFGVFLAGGINVKLVGEANDYVGKGMAGGEIVIVPPADAGFVAEEASIVGNTCLYGATGEASTGSVCWLVWKCVVLLCCVC